jgi:hypothetical protein
MEDDTKLIIALLAAVISAIVTLSVGVMTWVHNRSVLRESRISERRKLLTAVLNEFYGPFYYYLTVVGALSQLLFVGKPKEFRTLTYLLNPRQEYEVDGSKVRVDLSDSDKKIIEQMIDIEKILEQLVISKGGIIDDPTLMFNYIPDPKITDVVLKGKRIGLMALAITHFRVMRMAYNGEIKSEPERYAAYVYPRELDAKIFARIEALQKELAALTQ